MVGRRCSGYVIGVRMVHKIGTAGWSLPRSVRERVPEAGSLLERYASLFSCVEINTTFYRPHRTATYARWASSVPADFRFALKIPKEITHTRRLVDIDEALDRFLETSAALGAKRDVLLVQLPPSAAYAPGVVEAFFTRLRAAYAGRIACEPRHASWFDAPASAMLATFSIVRVRADPPPLAAPPGDEPYAEFRYYRLHGSERMYYSSYTPEQRATIVDEIRSSPEPAWCIFDNTAAGAAASDALSVMQMLGGGRSTRSG